jgi:hypothetical protein
VALVPGAAFGDDRHRPGNGWSRCLPPFRVSSDKPKIVRRFTINKQQACISIKSFR